MASGQQTSSEVMANPISVPIHMEHGGLILNPAQLHDGPHLVEMVQSVIITNEPAKANATDTAERLPSARVVVTLSSRREGAPEYGAFFRWGGLRRRRTPNKLVVGPKHVISK